MKRTHSHHHRLSGYLFAMAATAIWSGNFIIARGLIDNIQPVSLAFLRWSVAVLVLLPFALRTVIAERDIIRNNIIYLCVISLLGISLFNTLIYFAGHTTTALNLSLISITFPVFILILSRIFYNDHITLRKSAGIILVAGGIALLITKGNLSKLFDISFAIGDLWMLLAAVIFAVYSILLKQKPPQLSISALQLITFILGLLFLFPFFFAECMTGTEIVINTTTLFSILYVGVFASLSAFILWNKAIERIGPAKAGMIYYTLPLFSGASAFIFLHETISAVHFCSAACIIAGIIIANNSSQRSNS